ncbi:hypothetical protein FACS18949_11800 [Clostridia bacterium]|nr:hypothetical protein FACS18949_11800 [Clostridia bacterium]
MKKQKKLWLFLDGKKHCDVLQWAVAANMMIGDAKTELARMYECFSVEFKLI